MDARVAPVPDASRSMRKALSPVARFTPLSVVPNAAFAFFRLAVPPRGARGFARAGRRGAGSRAVTGRVVVSACESACAWIAPPSAVAVAASSPAAAPLSPSVIITVSDSVVVWGCWDCCDSDVEAQGRCCGHHTEVGRTHDCME
jgi:hypothetical protein